MGCTRVKGSSIGIACVVALLQTAAAAELPDCKLDEGGSPGSAMRGFALKEQMRYFMEVQGALSRCFHSVSHQYVARTPVGLRSETVSCESFAA